MTRHCYSCGHDDGCACTCCTPEARAIPTCPDCDMDLLPELDGFWCGPCRKRVEFAEAVFIEGDTVD